MTWETSERLAAHCRKMGDEAGALIYEARAARKKNYKATYYERQALEAEKNGNGEAAIKWRAIAVQKKVAEDNKPEVKTDGKKSKG